MQPRRIVDRIVDNPVDDTENPGDWVAGDQDGVVIIAREAMEAVAQALEEVREGATLPGWLEQAFAEKGVRYLD
jgi:hypothetical protein